MDYNFEWEPVKAGSNRQKHKISFELATTVFQDSLMVSVFDTEHGETGERWVTIGQAANGQVIVVIHTFVERDENNVTIRIISAREATKHEQRQYETK